MPSRTVSLLVLQLLLSGGTESVSAELRCALVIAPSKDDESPNPNRSSVAEITAALVANGFHCQQAVDLDEKQLKLTVDDFARRTPTLSTAVVCFVGATNEGKEGNTRTALLSAKNSRPDRGVSVSHILDALHRYGGSRYNALLISNAKKSIPVPAVPPDCLLALTNPEFTGTLRESSLPEALAKQGKILATGYDAGNLCREPVTAVAGPRYSLSAGQNPGDIWVNHRGMVFCWCPPGRFVAGSPDNTPGRYPDEVQRKVDIAQGFWIGKYELTLSQNLRNKPRKTIASHKNHPVTMLHHDDGKSMVIRTLTESERQAGRLPADWEYSLPDEEQWEYAARAGTESRFYFGDDLTLLPQHANFADRSWYETGDVYSNSADQTLNDGAPELNLVGSYKANQWGLHDVYGNVGEWCINHAVRGGAWVSQPQNCRSAYRDVFSARSERNYIGYRLVIQKVQKAP